MVARDDSSVVDSPFASETCSEELVDSVDSLLLFLSEQPGPHETEVSSSQPSDYVVTVQTSLSASESGPDLDSLPLPVPYSAIDNPSGPQGNGETIDRPRELEAELAAGLQTLYRLCRDIDERLGRTEDALHELRDVTSSTTLQEVCVGIESRLARTEAALQKTVEHAIELGTQLETGLARTEDVLRRVHETIAENSRLKELWAGIDRRLSRTEEALKRTESLAADKTLQQLSARIDVRLAEAEDAIRRIERSVGSTSFHHLYAKIDGRFTQTEEKLRRLEALLEARAASLDDARHVLAVDSQTADIRRVSSPRSPSVYRFAVASADMASRPGSLLRQTAGAIDAICLAAAETIARAQLSAQRLSAAVASTGVIGAARRGVRRCAPAAVLTIAMAVAATVRIDLRIEATPAAPVSNAAAVIPRGALEFLGSLAIASEPSGATVFVDGQLVGVTPLELPARRAGSLALQLTRDGFQRWTTAIQLPAGRLTQVKATLRPSVP